MARQMRQFLIFLASSPLISSVVEYNYKIRAFQMQVYIILEPCFASLHRHDSCPYRFTVKINLCLLALSDAACWAYLSRNRASTGKE